MPSAAEVKEQGQDVGNIQLLQQQKIEELTLYLLQLKKELDQQKATIKSLEEKLSEKNK